MRYLIYIFILFSLSLWADTTGNLLNQNFNTSDWSGTNKSTRHGNGTIAGVHGKYVESTISLSDTLTQSQINNGWTSTLGADIWHWNNLNSTTTMKQTITNSDGTVTTQIREVDLTGCGSINCGGYTTYTDSYTQGINSQSDYDIAVRFTFEESSQSSGHYGTDLKNPTLTIEHSLITAEQATTLSEISETVDEIIETQVETIEFEPLEEFVFEVFEEPELIMEIIEEIVFEELAMEEINTGIVEIFTVAIEEEIIPMEVSYEEPQTIEAFTTEVESFEEAVETTETINYETEAPGEEVSGERNEETNTNVAEEQTSNIEGGSEETIVAEKQGGTEGVSSEEVTATNEEESTSEDATSSETSGETNRDSDTSTNSESGSGAESDTEVSEVASQSIQVEDVEKQVAQTIKELDQQLVATSNIVASLMVTTNLDSYTNMNEDIFKNQPLIDGGNLDEYFQRNYSDGRNIYSENQISYNDPVFLYQTKIQETVDEVIRAEEHLRRIRGY